MNLSERDFKTRYWAHYCVTIRGDNTNIEELLTNDFSHNYYAPITFTTSGVSLIRVVSKEEVDLIRLVYDVEHVEPVNQVWCVI